MTTKTKKTYWRGYIDAQNKTHYLTKDPIVTAERAKTLKPLAEILKTEVLDYRGELFYIVLPKDYKETFPQKYNEHYLRGWFDAKGQVYKDPMKLTICGDGLKLFRSELQKKLELRLPKLQQPSAASKVMRLTITGDKARVALKFLRP